MPKLEVQTVILERANSYLPVRHERLQIDEQCRHCIIRLQTVDVDRAAKVGINLGVQEMPGPGAWIKTGSGVMIVWTSNLEWLALAPWEIEAELFYKISSSLDCDDGCVTLISDSRVSFSVRGQDASLWLSKSCTFHTDPAVFVTGMSTIAKFHGQAGMIIHDAPDSYLMYFDSPLAIYMAKILYETAREFS